jgi:dolichol-phosphate mannosyltransferase
MDPIPDRALAGVPELSVVIPFFNEGPNVGSLLRELREVIDHLGLTAEVIAVDDGSRDDTLSQLEQVARNWAAVRVVSLAQNSGQAAALWVGFSAAQGLWMATLDGDGQNPPAELARLWAVRGQTDMIIGRRITRQDSVLRKTMSRIANAVRQRLLRDQSHDTGCSLKIFRREVVVSFLPISTLYSFLPAFAIWGGWTVLEVPVAHRARRAGESKYGLRTMAWRPLVDLLSLAWLLRRRIPLRVRPVLASPAKVRA